MAVSDDYRDFVLEQLATAGRVTPRAMFGGVGLYLDGLFFALIDDDTLYFKTDDSNRARFEQAGSRPFCPFPDRPDQPMAYWQVPAEVLEDADQLAAWAREALAVALAKRTRRPARRRAPAARQRGRR
jgi:DNA transformation protein